MKKPKVYNKYHKNAPTDAVYIGRGSEFGNPFQIGRDGNRDEVCDTYEALIEANPKLKVKWIKLLKSKDLVCYCTPKRCHGDYLLRIANEQKTISQFKGKYNFLSNFYYPAPVTWGHIIYPTVENAYQAAKTYQRNRKPFTTCSASESKKLGRKVELREDWDKIKVRVMRSLIQQKFQEGTELGNKLIETGDAELIEGNYWHDYFWGVYNGQGKNWLGILLMEQRKLLQKL